MAPPGRSFEYPALRMPSSIRIIKLFPSGQESSPIIMELSEYPFNKSVIEFEALSYTWDDQVPTEEVTCNGTPLRVTKNVFLALRRLRDNKGRHRMLWIDAVSINQLDQAEKTSQVSVMGYIYAAAQRVNVWLSRPTEAMSRAFEVVRAYDDVGWRKDYKADATLNAGLMQLCSHRYWSRAWTVQETALNKNSWIYLGEHKIMNLITFSRCLSEIMGQMDGRSEAVAIPNPENLYPSESLRSSPTRNLRSHWSREHLNVVNRESLEILMAKKAQNPLDIIFSWILLLLPLTRILVNYKRELADVLKEATLHIIQDLKKLGDLLDLVSQCPAVPGAPSWTLNLTCGKHLYLACDYVGVWYATRKSRNTARVFSDKNVLYVGGSIVDRVSMVSDEFPHYALKDQASWHRDVHAMLSQWRSRTQGVLDKDFDEAVMDIFFAGLDVAEQLTTQLPADELSSHFHPLIYMDETDEKQPIRLPAGYDKQYEHESCSTWMHDPASPWRLDREEVLYSSHSEDNCSPTLHSPALATRNLVVTSNGRMALAKDVRVGDAIALLSSCDVPYILCPVPGTETYSLGKPVVCPGLMAGEAWPEDGVTGLEVLGIV